MRAKKWLVLAIQVVVAMSLVVFSSGASCRIGNDDCDVFCFGR